MTTNDLPTAVSVVDATDKKTIALSCGCAAVLRPPGYTDSGVSFYFCKDHVDPQVSDEAVVYDGDLSILHEPFGWDYTRWPGLKEA